MFNGCDEGIDAMLEFPCLLLTTSISKGALLWRLKVKENVERTQEQQEAINLQIDQLDESIKLMLDAKKIKEAD